jgi:thiamine kinase-like enzyme
MRPARCDPLKELQGEEAEEVRAILARIAVLPSVSMRLFRLSGFTNRSFLIERPGSNAYVLRLPGKGTERYIDRAAEMENARAAASIGLAPEILYGDPSSGILISVYIGAAYPLSPEKLRDRHHLQAAVDTLRRLHDSRLAFRGEMRLFPKLDQYLAIAGTRQLYALRRAVERFRDLIERGWGPLKPCHIDPAPHNFMAASGKYYLLDWEYAAMCEPIWDLAGLSIEGRFDAVQDAEMVRQYFAVRSTAEEQQWMSRLHIYRLPLRLLAAAWGAVQLDQGDARFTATELVDPLLAQTAADLGAADLSRHIAAAT